MEAVYTEYLDLRIKISHRGGSKTEELQDDEDDQLVNFSGSVSWPKVSPKHIFVLSYPSIMKKNGVVNQTHTNRAEAKNGQLKRKARLGNNAKNLPLTILRADNQFHATCLQKGVLSGIEVEVVKEGVTLSSDDGFFQWVREQRLDDYILADNVDVRQVKYTNNSMSVLLKADSMTNAFAIIKKIAVERKGAGHKPIVKLLYQKTFAEYLPLLGIYKLQPIANGFSSVKVCDLATPFPLYAYERNVQNVKSLFVSIKSQPFMR